MWILAGGGIRGADRTTHKIPYSGFPTKRGKINSTLNTRYSYNTRYSERNQAGKIRQLGVKLNAKHLEGVYLVSLKLRNEGNPARTLSVSNETWFSILELAEVYGWNPLGTFAPEWWLHSEPVHSGYDPYDRDGRVDEGDENNRKLVLLEDALNLADALELAFLEYEPERVRAFTQATLSVRAALEGRTRPSIGAISAVIDMCRLGSFYIEKG
jgi:hypothetical protein